MSGFVTHSGRVYRESESDYLNRSLPADRRLGDVRVFYKVRDDVVEVVLIGTKRGNRLVVAGEEFEL